MIRKHCWKFQQNHRFKASLQTKLQPASHRTIEICNFSALTQSACILFYCLYSLPSVRGSRRSHVHDHGQNEKKMSTVELYSLIDWIIHTQRTANSVNKNKYSVNLFEIGKMNVCTKRSTRERDIILAKAARITRRAQKTEKQVSDKFWFTMFFHSDLLCECVQAKIASHEQQTKKPCARNVYFSNFFFFGS